MKKTLLAGLALVALTGAAGAADLGVRAAPPPPPVAGAFVPASAFSWSGFYAGVNAGYAFEDNKNRFADVFVPAGTFGLNGPTLATTVSYTTSRNRDGFTGGGQLGYNVQFGQGSGIVLGVETDIQYADLNNQRRDRGFYTLSPAATRVGPSVVFVDPAGNRGVDWFGTVRGRVGYAFDRFLVYGTGGFAYGGGGVSDGLAYGRSNETRVGYAVGGGVEYALPTTSFLNFFNTNAVTLKVEGLYVDLERDSRKSAGSVFAYDTSTNTPYLASGLRRLDDTQFAVVRAGLNYKFGSY